MCSLSHPTCTLLGTCTMIVIKLEVHCFFFNDTAPTEIYTLSLHDALPISSTPSTRPPPGRRVGRAAVGARSEVPKRDRKSTRLNSSHPSISYAVFCLKKKKLTMSAFYNTSIRLYRSKLTDSNESYITHLFF